VRPGSWKPAITTFRDTIFGNCKYKLPRKFLRAALHVVCRRRTPSWFKWSTWQRRILQPAVLPDATAIPHATKYGAGSLPATPARCVLHSREQQGLCHNACEVISAVTQSYAFRREHLAIEGLFREDGAVTPDIVTLFISFKKGEVSRVSGTCGALCKQQYCGQ